MKLAIALTLLIALGFPAKAQTMKVKKGNVLLDGKLFLEMPARGGDVIHVCAPGESRPLVTARFLEFNNPQKRNAGNPTGRVYYIELRFAGVEETAEISNWQGGSRKTLARMIIDNEMLDGHGLNVENVREFILLTGTPFSEERNRITIIEHH